MVNARPMHLERLLPQFAARSNMYGFRSRQLTVQDIPPELFQQPAALQEFIKSNPTILQQLLHVSTLVCPMHAAATAYCPCILLVG